MHNNDSNFFEIFPWNKNFNTGIAIIDKQHQVLVDILNQLAANLANLSDSVKLDKIFNQLAEYADYHFKTESKIWARYFKDDTWHIEHNKTHDSFILQVIVIKNNKECKPLDTVIADIISFLSKWLAYHILDTDKRMAKAVLAMQSGYTLEEAKKRTNKEMSGAMKELIHAALSMYDNLSTRSLALMREKALRKQTEDALLHSEEQWKFILEGGAENIWDWDITHDNMLFSENNTLMANLLSNNFKNDTHNSHIHKADSKRVQAAFKAHIQGKTKFFISKYRVLQENGSWSWILNRAKVVSRDKHEKALRMIGTYSDVTQHELASLIYQNSSQAMLITDSHNHIISTNPAFTKITGYTQEESLGKNPNFLSSKQHNKDFYKQMWDTLKSTGHWYGELYNKRKNGELYPEMLNINTIMNSLGSVDHYVGLFTDITEKKKADALILEQASVDPLTKLDNRRMFLEKLEEEIQRSDRTNATFAMLFIDLDNFKEVNDSLGHEMGDMLLIIVTQRIKEHIRNSDIIARLGGDEFAIIFREMKDTLQIAQITQAIIDSLSQPFQLNIDQVYISASIGITLYPNDANNASSLLKNSDQAMYLAKNSGRSCYRYFTPSMQERAEKRQLLINDLHDALNQNLFQIYYQPIVNLKTGKIKKAEALIRWNHPKRGLISPNDFIPLAEKSGLIIQIGDWVYREAMRQTKIWKEKFNIEFQTSVNVSPVQFKLDRKLNKYKIDLDEFGLSGKNSAIEITESLLMEDENRITDKLSELREMGIEISLDDFGTGYSSLSYLKKFRIDYLKIDKSFISNLTQNSEDMALCKAIIVMAHTLGMKVIAEGIETPLQKQLIVDMCCDYAQGFYFSKPISADAFTKLLEKSEATPSISTFDI